MSVESDSRKTLGLLLRERREKLGWSRIRLSEESGVGRKVIVRLEHGVVNPSRHEFLAVIRVLNLPAHAREKAGRMVHAIFPRRRVKFHLHISILRRRNRIHRV